MTFDLKQAVSDANAAYFACQQESAPLEPECIPISVRDIEESKAGWPYRREWSMPFSDSMEEKI